jgi:hypothetical protein
MRPVEKLRCRGGNNIHKDLNYIGRGGVDWIHLAQVRIQWMAL